MILETKILPEVIFKMIKTDKIEVVEQDGNVILMPISREREKHPLQGKYKDCGFTLDEFIAMTREDKELER